ncbi:DNA-binding domain-containing protein [Gilvimarinus xylanilyticus]|uniref:DNA-binding domain-containing protein n=1 Tax=Gilvimarinus xylanilyticus TaxID=2944139 RepID=A0A9X2I506_9GAMM|nr:putative DNA-binding domain-containing protein [Gilvimarinus xylanilyticus]MCP8899027.1 putative DNA-binding domain-containing protein [Gilvimarinus xylanilyticus]
MSTAGETLQARFAKYLRDPDGQPAPDDIEARRLTIYRDLIYNNIEGFIAGGFPVLREILSDSAWHALVRDFVQRHHSQSPYFLEISQEFLHYLQRERPPTPSDPPFLLELAHYEWVELALDVAIAELPEVERVDSLLSHRIQVSPLLWCLSYRYPVHLLGRDFQPSEAPDAMTFLLVYRNRADRVEFMLSNEITLRFIKLLQSGDGTGEQMLATLAAEIAHPTPSQLLPFASDLLADLQTRDILWAKP